MIEIILNEKIEIPPTPEKEGEDGNGVFSFIYRGPQMKEIQSIWDRQDCCLKILKNIHTTFREDFEQQIWGPDAGARGSYLKEATFIQNLYATYDLAPRVYAVLIVVINGEKHWAQLTDDLGHWEYQPGKQNELMTGLITTVAEEYNIAPFDDGRNYNIMQDKYVDFQGFHLKEDYLPKFKERLKTLATIGKWGPFQNYQSIPQLDIIGGRPEMQHRIENIGLDKINFKNKTVLDIGCSEGIFCQYAIDRGAKRVVGVDLLEVASLAAELAYYLGYNNIDLEGFDLKKESPEILGRFDIVLFLSMGMHIGFPQWIKNMTKDLLIFEGNSRDEDQVCISTIEDSFGKIEKKGETTDLFRRPIVWAKP